MVKLGTAFTPPFTGTSIAGADVFAITNNIYGRLTDEGDDPVGGYWVHRLDLRSNDRHRL